MNKFFEIMFVFWIMKICVMMFGEIGGDLLLMMLNVGYVVSLILLFGFFFVMLGV